MAGAVATSAVGRSPSGKSQSRKLSRPDELGAARSGAFFSPAGSGPCLPPIRKGVVSTLPWKFVSKSAVLLTGWVFEGDLVSKMPNLLTEWVFESDLVSKMADLLTEKGAECGRATLTAKRWPSGF